MTVSSHSCDILIIGGGPVGALFASLASSLPFSIILVDQADPVQACHQDHDGRTTAISWGSAQILEKAGVWTQIFPHTTPIKEIRVSQASKPGFIHFTQEDAHHHPMGFIVENGILRKALYENLKAHAQIRIMAPSSLDALSFHPSYGEAHLKEGQRIRASLIVGGDGRFSQVKKQAHIKSYTSSYHQTALVTSVTHEAPHHHIAFEHFLPTGPLAFLPLHTHQSSVVWSLETPLAQAVQGLSPQGLAQELFLRFPYLGKLEVTSKCWAYPLSVTLAPSLRGERCVLIGDAGHSIHPIAGQGANVGFRDAEVLARLLGDHGKLGLDLGVPFVLKQYQRRRRPDILSMTALTHGLVRLFSTSAPGFPFLRSQGMNLVNAFPPLRQRLARHAMGLGFLISP